MSDNAVQEIYDDFMKETIRCVMCKADVPFSEILDWGEGSGPTNVVCPLCELPYQIRDEGTITKMRKLADIDRKLADIIILVADAGALEERESHKIAMILKYHFKFQPGVFESHPLSYLDRIAMRVVYDEIIAASLAQPINIYEARAPVPISFEKQKRPIAPPTFSGLGGKTKKRKKGSKGKSQPKLSFGFSPPPSNTPDTKEGGEE